MTFAIPVGKKATNVQVILDGVVLQAEHRMADGRVEIQLADATAIQTDQLLEIRIHI